MRLTLATVWIAMLCGPAISAQLTNSDFERPGGWKLPSAAGERCRIVDDDGRSGKNCLLFKLDQPSSVGPVQQTFECKPNQEYVLTAAFKLGSGEAPLVAVSVPGQPRKVNVTLTADHKATWHAKSVRFNSGTHEKLLVSIYACRQAARDKPCPPGTAWVDDVNVLLPDEVPAQASVEGGFTGKPIGRNIALGKPYTFAKKPNYGYCTDPGDATQLTDGEYSVGYFWVQKSTVGWSRGWPLSVTVDLGRVEPIAGVSYSTAAGTAGVAWPTLVFIMTSEDGKSYRCAGDLIEMSADHGMPAPDKYSTHRFVTGKLRTKGRYVKLVIKSAGTYTFCDEVEVYRGADEWLAAPMAGELVDDVGKAVARSATEAGIKYRLRKDLIDMRQAVKDAKLDAKTRAELLSRLQSLKDQIAEFRPAAQEGFRAVVPLNSLHAEILKTNAALLRARGLDGFTAWHKNRWDMLQPTEGPPQVPAPWPDLEVSMMDNEHRAEVVNLTNATDTPATASVIVNGLPGGVNPQYVTVHQVEFVDTQEKIVIADALVPAASGTASITIPAGMTRQLWLSFHPQNLQPGTYPGKIEIDAGQHGLHHVPLTLRVFPLRFPDQPTCSLGVWDYTAGRGSYDIAPGNRDAAIRNMREHFVDTPWASGGTAPWPKASDFGPQGDLVGKLGFERFDQWVADWKGARNYYVFMSVRDHLASAKRGTERFDRAVSSWAKAWAAHNAELGLKPGQVGVLLVDEPSREEQEQRILDWATAIKQGTSDIVIWEDPVHRAPWKSSVPGMFKICDVLCPNVGIYMAGGERAKRFYGSLRSAGAKLWLYQCSGPARLHDPYYYHRLQHWHCWNAGAVGSGFWAYGDSAGTSTWNDYAAKRTSFTPVYLDADSVTDGKHWEAVREGIEDYEYLRMLRDRVSALSHAGATGVEFALARKLLEELPRQVATYRAGDLPWLRPKDRSAADTARVRILEALAALPEARP